VRAGLPAPGAGKFGLAANAQSKKVAGNPALFTTNVSPDLQTRL